MDFTTHPNLTEVSYEYDDVLRHSDRKEKGAPVFKIRTLKFSELHRITKDTRILVIPYSSEKEKTLFEVLVTSVKRLKKRNVVRVGLKYGLYETWKEILDQDAPYGNNSVVFVEILERRNSNGYA